MGRFLWGTFLPVVGLLTVFAAPFMVLVFLYYEYDFSPFPQSEYEIVMTEVAAERRFPSEDGAYEFVVFRLNTRSGTGLTTVVASGTPVHPVFNDGVQFGTMANDNFTQLPFEVDWVQADVIRLTYCGRLIRGGNAIISEFGSFDAEFVRRDDCDVAVGSNLDRSIWSY